MSSKSVWPNSCEGTRSSRDCERPDVGCEGQNVVVTQFALGARHHAAGGSTGLEPFQRLGDLGRDQSVQAFRPAERPPLPGFAVAFAAALRVQGLPARLEFRRSVLFARHERREQEDGKAESECDGAAFQGTAPFPRLWWAGCADAMPMLGRILKPSNASALLLIGCLSACDGDQLAQVGKPAPELQALDLDGQSVTLAGFRGQVVLVNFWLGGCVPCVTEAPIIQEIYETHKHGGLTVLSINVGGNATIVRDFIDETDVTFDFAVDQLSLTATRFGVAAFPTTFIVDRSGVVREKILGEVQKGAVEDALAPLL